MDKNDEIQIKINKKEGFTLSACCSEVIIFDIVDFFKK